MSAASTPGARPSLRVVIFREGESWLAQGLEHDLGVQAENLKDLVARLALALARPDLDTPLETLPPAPKYFQDLWALRSGEFLPLTDALAAAPVEVLCGMVV